MTCDRCGKQTNGSTGSYFNTQQICFACSDLERKHPAFEEARRVENEAVARGNFNYPGIGLPTDLRSGA
jgi:hypothetical protein